jgi:putative transposase
LKNARIATQLNVGYYRELQPRIKYNEFIGKPISECIQQLSGKDVDAVVRIAFKRRKYKGKQKKDEIRVRLVAVYNDEDQKHHI